MEGTSISRLPMLKQTSYAYLSGVKTSKPKVKWISEEDKLANANSKVHNAIFSEIGPLDFRHISKCTVAKKVWIILKTK
ncbi:hypothetical protein Goshw_022581 [Gossypium schwendimanii]|uniref:Uncharacterized protein n=1 Tax=Gossypium schwendimanii TaxID=34291 RepID=A0A7J9N195_GOSSC|nr:hypothetical protein [Gossypium schwendimanii]